jgi:MoaA/NifB/PqqE/SkfB family radical SAM enzyme
MIETRDTLCAYAWTHVFVSNAGKQLPCCFAGSNVNEVRLSELDMGAVDLHGIWNSPQLRELRLQMMRGEEPPICAGCFKTEKSGRRSPRQEVNAVYSPKTIRELVQATGPDGSLNRGFRSVDLRLGNECNLRCRMCSPYASRKLIPEWSQTGNQEMMRIAELSSEQRPWGTRKEIWDSLLASAAEVESIHFAGGEPMLIDAHHDFLRKLIASGRAGRIRLSYNSNLTRMLPDLENYLAHFKEIHIIGSLDGYAKLNWYIRFPAKWDQLVQNLRALDELASTNPNLSIGLHTTVQAYNLTRIVELLHFLEESNFRKVPAVPYFTPVTIPSYFNPRVLSPALKTMARDCFLEFIELRESKPATRKTEGRSEDQMLEDLGKILDAAIEESSPRDTAMFVKITRFFDLKRKHRLIDVASEFQEMFGLTPPTPAFSAPDLAGITVFPEARIGATTS